MKPKPKKPPRVFAPLPCGAVLLSLDVSSSVTGWATGRIDHDNNLDVLDFGIIKPPSIRTSAERADWMSMRIARILKEHDVASVVMEWQSHLSSGKRVQGLSVLGQAQGAIRACLAMTHRVELVSEREHTKLNGKNTKKEIRAEHIRRLIPAYAEAVAANPKLDPGYDMADALNLLVFRTSQ